jgi:hypothetical protein
MDPQLHKKLPNRRDRAVMGKQNRLPRLRRYGEQPKSGTERRFENQHRQECLCHKSLQRSRGILYPCKPKAGLHGAQAAVHESS